MLAFGARLSTLPVLGSVLPIVELTMLILAVAVAVHHAETIAHRLGEPYGTLVLTMAVTVIECSLILAVMLSGDGNATLARDTVFSVIMLVCNGLVGLCFLIGGLRWGEQTFRTTSARAYLMVLVPFGVLTMVLPGFTTSAAGPFYSTAQIAFVSMVTLALYGIFLYVQTVRHRGFFDVEGGEGGAETEPSMASATMPYALLGIALIAIVLLAKSFAASIAFAVAAIGAPPAIVGVLVALLVLLPESVAAIQAARADQLQRSINLALGSSLATIGLTFPAVGALSLVLGKPLVLALGPTEMVLLVLTLVVSMVTFSGGRTNILSGSVHLVLLATFVFLIFVP
ncbi:calcium:proton antiporter [Pinisolibacter aquiterrae]|uniref:calcium:proton antiporter n=1 Tax=Pinisolibacter aquiterrae TaxID=2815579 RepID=UPI003B75C054